MDEGVAFAIAPLAPGTRCAEAPRIPMDATRKLALSVLLVLGAVAGAAPVRGADPPPVPGERHIDVLPLKDADAGEIVRELQKAFPDRVKVVTQGTRPPGGANEPPLLVTFDAATNSIVILSSPAEDLEALRKMVAALDVPPQKVLLEVLLARAPVLPSDQILWGAWVSANGAELGIPIGTVSDEARRLAWTSEDPFVITRPDLLTRDHTTAELSFHLGDGLSRAVCSAGSVIGSVAIARFGRLRITPHLQATKHVRLDVEVSVCEKGAKPARDAPSCEWRTRKTVVVVADEQTVALRPFDDGCRPGVASPHGVESLFVMVSPYRIAGEDDRREIFERRMRDRQIFLDRWYVFGERSNLTPLPARPPRRGLLSEIRLAQRSALATSP